MALAPEDREAIVEAISAGFVAGNKQSSAAPSPGGGGSSGNLDSVAAGMKGALGGLVGAVNSAGGSLTQFSGAVTSVIPDLGKFGSVVKLGANATVAYLEDTMGAFNDLSKVGSSLSGSLGEVRLITAQTNMDLDTLSSMIQNNSQALAAMGGGVSSGVRDFARLSKLMNDGGTIDQFMRLGYTVEEANEFLLSNNSMLNRQARLTNMTDQQQLNSAVAFAKQLDIMAKLTGRNARELREETRGRMEAGDVMATAMLLESQGVVGASGALQAAQGAMADAPELFQQAFSEIYRFGTTVNKDTNGLMSMNAETERLMIASAEASKRGNAEEAKRLMDQARTQFLQDQTSQENLFNAQNAHFSEVGRAQAKVMEEDMNTRRAILNVQAEMKKAGDKEVTFAEARNELMRRAAEEQSEQTNAQSDQTQAMRLVQESQQELRKASSELNTVLAKQLNGEGGLSDTFRKGAKAVDGSTQALIDAFNNAAESLPDATQKAVNAASDRVVDPGDEERGQRFSIGQALKNTLGDFFSGRYTGGTISPGVPYTVGERGPEIIIPGSAGNVMNAQQTANVAQMAREGSQNDMRAVVTELSALNEKTEALLRINTKQASINIDHLRAVRGAGNLLRGVS